MPIGDRFCVAWLDERVMSGLDRAAMWRKAQWVPGQAIRVAFLEGSAALRARVLAVAREWTGLGMANLELQERPDAHDSDVRISMSPGRGSWSLIGTTCRERPAPHATMSFGWLGEASDEDTLRATVLHEFGHALGLVHEHASPAAGIRWDEQAVEKDLGDWPHFWSRERIAANVIRPSAADETNFTTRDPLSIMHYPIPREWTLDGYSTDFNRTHSATDRAFIAAQYPY